MREETSDKGIYKPYWRLATLNGTRGYTYEQSNQIVLYKPCFAGISNELHKSVSSSPEEPLKIRDENNERITWAEHVIHIPFLEYFRNCVYNPRHIIESC